MGNWAIHIEGVGWHHNKAEDDANEMAKVFVKQLREKGHRVDSASFHSCGKDDLTQE